MDEKIIITEDENSLWLPLRTVSRHEKKLYGYFVKNGIPAYLPLIPGVKVHNVSIGNSSYHYENEVLRPMLTSYVFARLDAKQRTNVWKTKSVQTILDVPMYQQRSFIEELRGLQLMEELAFSSKIEFKKELQVNDRFVIEKPRGFDGTCGYLVERRKRYLWVIKLELLGQYISAEIDPREYEFRKIN